MIDDHMTARQRLDAYLHNLRVRIRTQIVARTAAASLTAVLLGTVVAVLILSRTGFAASITMGARILLVSSVVAIVVTLLWLPLRRLKVASGSDEFERRLPAQQGRIQTYLDMRRREALGERTAFAELLAEDAARVADASPVETVVVGKQVWGPAAAAAIALAVMVGLLTMGPGQWGYGTRHLLLGSHIPRAVVPERHIVVTPGNITVRRNSDLSIVATMQGFSPKAPAVFVRFDDEDRWQKAPMQAQADGSESWAFKVYALRGPLHYYVAADESRSQEHTVGVADLPKIEKVRLTYSYPRWTGLKEMTDDEQRDIRAVTATQVKVEVFADAPLQSPALIVNGEASQIAATGNTATGNVTVSKPGNYFIGAKVLNDFVALTDDYEIEVINDKKPSIEILKPGRDWRATNIEEVPVRVQAQDDFRLQDVELRYAVNGGKWQSVNLPSGQREMKTDSMLRLEELGAAQPALDAQLPGQLAPGDLVSYYAVAKDRSKEVQTDLFMVQVQPFERRFTQNQAGGGGGGGGGEEQGAISERQKEILLATWNLQRSDSNAEGSARRTRKQLEENAVMLAELQTTLAQQARTVAERTRARVSIDQDPRVKAFVESMERAASIMDPAAAHLKAFKLEQAVPVEQQALQQLLRAEAAFRDVQVSMQQESASNGGGAEAARNFSEMFELEMDLQKNQYETQSQLSQESRQQEVDEAIRKLKELAERQEKLAQQAQRKAIPQQEQRWRQEQLRREAEDLKRRLAELAKEQQGSKSGAQQGQQAGNQSGSQQAGEAGGAASGQPNGDSQRNEQRGGDRERQREQLAKTLKSLTKALDDMRAANAKNDGERTDADQGSKSEAGGEKNLQAGNQPGESGSQSQSGEDTSGGATQLATQAGRSLRQALKQMERPPEQGIGESVDRLADRAEQLVESQREVESELQEALSEAVQANRRRGAIDPKRARALAEAKQTMARELSRVQDEMRGTVQDHRREAPAATKRLMETLSEVEGSNVNFRIGRSADEVLYGRAREAAAREGLIEEALQTLEKGLRESATLAAQAGDKPADEATPEQMLARIAQLRRSLQQAQREQSGAQDQRSASQSSPPSTGSSQSQESQSQESRGNSSSQSPGSQQGSNPNGNRPNGLSAWNPSTPSGSMSPETGAGQYREATELSEQMRQLANRMNGSEMNSADLNAMRRMTQDLRRLAGDPMQAQAASMTQLIDRIELAALAAVQKGSDRAASRTTVQNVDTPEYREAVAEYYRRLGATRAGGGR